MGDMADMVNDDMPEEIYWKPNYRKNELPCSPTCKHEAMNQMDWIRVEDRLPETGVKVIAFFRNKYNKNRRIMAFHCPAYTIEDDGEESEYCEANDTYYLRPGWYEQNEFDDFYYLVGATVTHWMALPEPPKGEL